tara:strand:+ start:97 stop:519 length:423 start_codon:yes stop_codon:yes gene_type:complete
MTTYLGTAIRTRLINDTDVTDVCEQRVYPQAFPENVTFPAVRYSLTGSSRQPLVDAASGVVESDFQIDIYASTYLVCHQLAKAVRETLQQYTGVVGSLDILGIRVVNQMDLYEPPVDSDDVGLFRVIFDFEVVHGESVPS